MSRLTTRIGMLALSIALLLPVLIYAYGSIYIRYLADDYCVVAVDRQLGLLKALQFYYTAWSGRFVAMTSATLVLPAGLGVGTMALLLMLGIWWLALFGIVRAFAIARQLPHPVMLSASAVSLGLLVILNSAFNIVQSVYFLSGSLLYLLPLVLFTVYVLIVVTQWMTPTQNRVLKVFLLTLSMSLSFLAAGTSEMYGLLQVIGVTIVCWLCWKYSTTRHILPFLLLGLGSSVIALMIELAAPGNYVRLGVSARPDMLSLLLGTFTGPFATLYVTARFWPFSPILLLVLPAWVAYTFDSKPLGKASIYMILTPILAYLLVAMCFAMVFFATANPPPERAWIILQYVVFGGAVIWSYLFGKMVKQARTAPNPPLWQRYAVGLLLIVTIVGSLLQSTRIVNNLRDYAMAWDKQDSEIRAQATPTATIIAIPVHNISGLTDISQGSKFWLNSCMARFYGVAAIEGDPAFTQFKDNHGDFTWLP